MSNDETIQRFYRAFDAGDAEAMAACYAPDVHFSDPVFPDLHGEEAGDMWRMLLDGPGDVGIELTEHEAGPDRGSAHWRATYNFTQTGRDVVNEVDARFRFEDGLIVEHHDDFDFWRWSRQAFGPLGVALGWTPILKGAVRKKVAQRLEKFRSERAAA